MRDCCPANQFSGCCEGRECTSKAVHLGKFTKPTDRTLNTVLAKDRAGWAVRYGASVAIAVVALSIIASFVFIAVPESKRLALVNQENVSYVQR
jgi:hypothetical protein